MLTANNSTRKVVASAAVRCFSSSPGGGQGGRGGSRELIGSGKALRAFEKFQQRRQQQKQTAKKDNVAPQASQSTAGATAESSSQDTDDKTKQQQQQQTTRLHRSGRPKKENVAQTYFEKARSGQLNKHHESGIPKLIASKPKGHTTQNPSPFGASSDTVSSRKDHLDADKILQEILSPLPEDQDQSQPRGLGGRGNFGGQQQSDGFYSSGRFRGQYGRGGGRGGGGRGRGGRGRGGGRGGRGRGGGRYGNDEPYSVFDGKHWEKYGVDKINMKLPSQYLFDEDDEDMFDQWKAPYSLDEFEKHPNVHKDSKGYYTFTYDDKWGEDDPKDIDDDFVSIPEEMTEEDIEQQESMRNKTPEEVRQAKLGLTDRSRLAPNAEEAFFFQEVLNPEVAFRGNARPPLEEQNTLLPLKTHGPNIDEFVAADLEHPSLYSESSLYDLHPESQRLPKPYVKKHSRKNPSEEFVTSYKRFIFVKGLPIQKVAKNMDSEDDSDVDIENPLYEIQLKKFVSGLFNVKSEQVSAASKNSAFIGFKTEEGRSGTFELMSRLPEKNKIYNGRRMQYFKAKRELEFKGYTGPINDDANYEQGVRLLVGDNYDAPTKKLFVTHYDVICVENVPPHVTKRELSNFFQPYCYDPRDVDGSIEFVTCYEGHRTGKVYVGFDLDGQADDVIEKLGWRVPFYDSDNSKHMIRLHKVKEHGAQKFLQREVRPLRNEEELLNSLNNWEQYVSDDDLKFLDEHGFVDKRVLDDIFRTVRFHNPYYAVGDQAISEDKVEKDVPSGEQYREFVTEYIATLKECIPSKDNPGFIYESMFFPDEQVDLSMIDELKKQWEQKKIDEANEVNKSVFEKMIEKGLIDPKRKDYKAPQFVYKDWGELSGAARKYQWVFRKESMDHHVNRDHIRPEV